MQFEITLVVSKVVLIDSIIDYRFQGCQDFENLKAVQKYIKLPIVKNVRASQISRPTPKGT